MKHFFSVFVPTLYEELTVLPYCNCGLIHSREVSGFKSLSWEIYLFSSMDAWISTSSTVTPYGMHACSQSNSKKYATLYLF